MRQPLMTAKAQLLNLIEHAPESHLGSLLHYAQRLQDSTAAEALTHCLDYILASSQQFEDAEHPEVLSDFCDRVVNQTQTLQQSNGVASSQDSPFNHQVLDRFSNGQQHHAIFSDEREVELDTETLSTLPDPLQKIIGVVSVEGLSDNIDEDLYGTSVIC